MINKIENLINKCQELSDAMMDPNAMSDMKHYTKIAKEYKSLEDIVNQGKHYISLINQLEEYNEVMNSSDEELKELIKDDILTIKVYLKGKLPTGLQMLSSSINDFLISNFPIFKYSYLDIFLFIPPSSKFTNTSFSFSYRREK